MKIKKLARSKKKQNRNIQIIISIAVLLIVSLLLIANQNNKQLEVQRAMPGKSVGNFSLNDIENKTIKLSDYKGKYVLLNAWATWCPPCRAEMPALNAFYQEHKEKGFEILAINAGETRDEAAHFANSYSLGFKVLLDTDGQVITGLGITAFPTSILLDPEGKVAFMHFGMLFPDDLNSKILPHLQK